MFMLAFAIWLIVNVCATSFVSRNVEDADNRIAYLALVWCIPLFGALVATIVAAQRALRNDEDSSGKLPSAIAEAEESSGD